MIQGFVINQRGEPIAEATIAVIKSSVTYLDLAPLTGPDGSFAHSDLAPGIYLFSINAEGYQSKLLEYLEEEGKTKNVVIELEEVK